MDNLKVTPYNLEAEQSVLGSMLLSNEAIIVAMDKLKPEILQRIPSENFEIITRLNENREPVDLITVTEALGLIRYWNRLVVPYILLL